MLFQKQQNKQQYLKMKLTSALASKKQKASKEISEEQTTQITQKSLSFKNSLLLLFNKNNISSVQHIFEGPSKELRNARQKKQFINMTIGSINSNNKHKQSNTQRNKQNKYLNIFNFCQDVPKNQTFYTKLYPSKKECSQKAKCKTQRVVHRKAGNEEEQAIKGKSITITELGTPINKLTQLQRSPQEKQQLQGGIQTSEFVSELQSLLQKL